MSRYKAGSLVRLIKDISGDLPKRYIGRRGRITKHPVGIEDGHFTYRVKFKERAEPLVCWHDELRQ